MPKKTAADARVKSPCFVGTGEERLPSKTTSCRRPQLKKQAFEGTLEVARRAPLALLADT